MRIAILSGGDGWHVRDLLRAAADLGHLGEVVDFRRVGASVNSPFSQYLDQFDAIVVRTMPPGSLEQVVFRMDRLHALAERGIPILNPPRALEVCVDKYLALVRLDSAGLRVPETVVCQHADAALDAFERLGRDVVVKPLFGSEGRGMVRVTDPELAWRTFRAIERTQAVIYVQRFVAHPGWDLRAFVLDSRVIAAVRRVSNGDWRTNVSQGARAEPVKLTAEQESLALRASAAVGTIAAGVDLLPGPSREMYVIEVNAVPGWRALGPATGVDVARALIETLCPAPPFPHREGGPGGLGLASPTTHLTPQPPSLRGKGESIFCLAAVWEATARKAGNVHPERNFDDVTYADFLMSAAAAAPALESAQSRPLGETVLAAIQATRSVVHTNTNLGIVLLLAPLAKVADGVDLRAGVKNVLGQTTVTDAAKVFEAIRLAAPGGLGKSNEQDVHEAPTMPLRDVMALAADRDMIARQYANDFADVFELGIPALLEGLRQFGRIEPAVQHCQLLWLATHPDSLILRKRGSEIAAEASRRASIVLELGGLATPDGHESYADFDQWLRADGHARNPGTTADLITACLFVALRERKIAVDTPL